MKTTIIGLFILITTTGSIVAQTWTADQLAQANTAKNVPVISTVEKEAIMYLNLARLYPQQFCKNEVANCYGPKGCGEYYKDSPYRKSLMTHLNSMKPVGVLYFYEPYFKTAKCLAEEQAITGNRGHERTTCTQFEGRAECVAYGMGNGKDVALQWLIDHNVESLGHREACLDGKFTKIGISYGKHPKEGYCAVADFG